MPKSVKKLTFQQARRQFDAALKQLPQARPPTKTERELSNARQRGYNEAHQDFDKQIGALVKTHELEITGMQKDVTDTLVALLMRVRRI